MTRIMIGIGENFIGIAVKKLFVNRFNIRATPWWFASLAFSIIMLTKDVAMNLGKVLASDVHDGNSFKTNQKF